MKSRPLRPTHITLTFADWPTMNWAAALLMLELRPPVSPRSGVITTTCTLLTSRRLSRGGSRSSSWGCAARCDSRLCIRSEYGRPLSADSWARRIFDAAIIDMALVIFAVFSTLRMRRRICLTLGMVLP